jgi:hypothetical protein
VALFQKGSIYTRQQIHETLGGSRREALPTKGGNIVCACLTRRMNPRAPDEIVIGGTERARKRARTFAASGAAVPVFVKAHRGGWECAGERRVRSVIEEPGALLSRVAEGAPADATRALLLEEVPQGPAAAVEVPAGQPPARKGA